MSYSNISATLAPADLDTVKAAIATINSKLPFLINLDNDEIRTLFKLGPKSANFVSDARDAANNFGQILPPTFNKAEFLKDADLFKQLTEIKLLVDSLAEKVDNTTTAVGSEAMTSSREVYAYVQTAADRTPGLKSVAEKLKERFKAGKASKAPTAK